MDGYVMNVSHTWTHAMKRSVGPGAKIPLNELYEQYGVKYDIKEGEEFVIWLRNVKLRDSDKWKVVFDDTNIEPVTDKKDQKTPYNDNDNVAPMVKVKDDVMDIVNLSVRQAREKLPRVTDLKLLKQALREANQLAGKDSLCKIIRNRIKYLQI
jgi:hypothetical protein